MKNIKTIGILTSGGDAPGMNAAIRAVVRTAIYHSCEVVGVKYGFFGLLNNLFIPLQSHSVSQKISTGGTFLKSTRCPQFLQQEARAIAYENIRNQGIDALIVIGGNGSFRGADTICKEMGIPVVGIPGTIDNDIYGTDCTIGFDTAVNTAVRAVDKLRDTADSHNMVFFVEVMGRDAGFIALNTSISSGAEATLIPEIPTTIDQLCNYLEMERRANKTSGIIIVAEGGEHGGAAEIATQVKKRLPQYETRVTTLGHIQRGGAPTANDRILGGLLGHDAVVALINGEKGIMVGRRNDQTVYTSFEEACSRHCEINKRMVEIAYILSL
ncbi:MAG: 6-phosphofructokinase [Bacteroidales bacterium]